jgi:hypothetical protein
MPRPRIEIDQEQLHILKNLGAMPFDFEELGFTAPNDFLDTLKLESKEFANRLLRMFPEKKFSIKHAFKSGFKRSIEVQILRTRLGTGISNHSRQNGFEHVSMSKQAIELTLGYSLEELKLSFDSLFEPGFSWNNPSDWQIDHIVPMSRFKFKRFSDEAFQECWSINNLRPLCKIKNRKKSDHYGDL